MVVRMPPARPCGAQGECVSRQRSRRFAFRRRPSARPVRFRVVSPVPSPALPPTLWPALRAPRSGPRRRRPQPFISAAASAGVVYWLQQLSPTSSRRPTARQVEASSRWRGLASWGLLSPDSGPFALAVCFLSWPSFCGGLSGRKTGQALLCPALGVEGAKLS